MLRSLDKPFSQIFWSIKRKQGYSGALAPYVHVRWQDRILALSLFSFGKYFQDSTTLRILALTRLFLYRQVFFSVPGDGNTCLRGSFEEKASTIKAGIEQEYLPEKSFRRKGKYNSSRQRARILAWEEFSLKRQVLLEYEEGGNTCLLWSDLCQEVNWWTNKLFLDCHICVICQHLEGALI